ncbi:EcsC family protein [Bacillus rubiinfantis]|uniref:EcsC family protein n=1 Tax=Bacillus rubiinfantis TaxID=1499680 RepID=UPI0005AA40CE|nr:EcsC family protein [Bacillus rubiinfantis]
MPLNNQESKVLNEIREWEEQLLHSQNNDYLITYEQYLEKTFSRLPKTIQSHFFSLIDTWLFHLHGMIQSSQFQQDAKERIMATGRIFEKDIEGIDDLRNLTIHQLQYIAEQQISRHRFYSFVQGGLSGTGGPLLLAADIPAIAVVNLRAVQLIATAYGHEINTPYEMMTSLKVFHTGTMPPHMLKAAWCSLVEGLETGEGSYFYEGKEEITDISWINQPFKQLLKAIVIMLFRKKLIQGIPLVGMAIGAGTNYQLTRKVTNIAHKYYQLRYLKSKGEC